LTDVGIELNEITPTFIRDNLREISSGIEFPVALSEIPIAMLAKRSWFLEIVAYCADEGEDYTLIDGLPLELTLEQKYMLLELTHYLTTLLIFSYFKIEKTFF
jgi:hypothetical protein